jgi:predicted nucleotidyltransferase
MSSVRVISPDWTGILDRLQSWADDLVASDTNVLGVLLYGSLARDDHAPGSDGDLIIVVEDSQDDPADRACRLRIPRIGVPVDLTVYTDAELSHLISEKLPFLKRAMAEGRWLATAPGWKNPHAEEIAVPD